MIKALPTISRLLAPLLLLALLLLCACVGYLANQLACLEPLECTLNRWVCSGSGGYRWWV